MPARSSDNILFGKRLRESRKVRRISLEQLSRGTELSVSFLSRLERGQVNISVDNLKKIANFLGIRMVELLEVHCGVGVIMVNSAACILA